MMTRDFLRSDVEAEYLRWMKQIPEYPRGSPTSLTCQEVLRAHFLVADHFADKGEGDPMLGIGPRSVDLLVSAVGRQHVGLGGTRKWSTPYDITATLFFGLVKNHAFIDGNKRTALLSALYQLSKNHRIPTVKQSELDMLAIRVADDRLGEYSIFEKQEGKDDAEVRFLGQYFRNNTRPADDRQYLITYRELDTVLRRHGCHLREASGNQIDVVREVDDYVGVIAFKKKKVEKRIMQIGFRDWGTEVPRQDIKSIRKALQLTPEHGCDSAVFYDGVDPLKSLIREYEAPLLRLASR